MAEEENNEETADNGRQPAEEVAEEPAAEAEEPAAEEPAAEEPAEEPAAEEAHAPAAAAPAEPEREAVVHPKERRKRARSARSGEARPPQTPEEREAARLVRRKALAAARSRRRARARTKRGEPGTGTSPAERVAGTMRVRQGVVVSSRADKTITVKVETAHRHRMYEKVVRRSTTVHAHDERNEANAGDTVRVIETRPMSKLKRWRLVEILERAR